MTKKYNLLVMSNESDVFRFQLGPPLILAVLAVLSALVILSAMGVYLGIQLLRPDSSLHRETRELKAQLQETQSELERLQGSSVSGGAGTARGSRSARDTPELADILSRVDLNQAKVANLRAALAGQFLSLSFDISNPDISRPLKGRLEISLITRNGKRKELELSGKDKTYLIQRYKSIQIRSPLPDGLGRDDLFGLRLVLFNSSEEVIFSETFALSGLLS